MDQSNIPIVTVHHNGWTEARRTAFLEHLAACGNVRAACARVGMSHEAAYRLKRRDTLFARAWDAALLLAREASAEVLACRALDGVEEEVWHRGEVVGTRRRYDTRLLLAHMARLDALAGSQRASEDAARFDELLALVGGALPHAELALDEDGVPLPRGRQVEMAMLAADEIAADEHADSGARGPHVPDPAARFRAAADMAAHCDAWRDEACETVDRLHRVGGGIAPAWTPSTPSTLSTSPLADRPAHGQPAASG